MYPKPCDYMVENLPKSRLTATRPFKICGVDYGGPVTLKLGNVR